MSLGKAQLEQPRSETSHENPIEAEQEEPNS